MQNKELLEIIECCIEDDNFCPPALVEQIDVGVYRVYQHQDGVERYTLVCVGENTVFASWFIVNDEPNFTDLGYSYDLPADGTDIMIVEGYSGNEALDNMVDEESKHHKVVLRECA